LNAFGLSGRQPPAIEAAGGRARRRRGSFVQELFHGGVTVINGAPASEGIPSNF
jgi:hypothetical protein